MEDLKCCCGCKEDKPFKDFCKSKSGKFGLHNHCRACNKQRRRKWLSENREQAAAYFKSPEYKKAKSIARHKKYHSDEKWRKDHLEKNKKRRKGEVAKLKKKIHAKKYYLIPHNRIASSLRRRIHTVLFEVAIKSAKTETLLGCSFEECKEFLESKFQSGMTWENYGREGWHIDHVIPCSFFDLSRVDHQKICFNYRNLQPMWANENYSKRAKILIEDIDSFINEIKKEIGLV